MVRNEKISARQFGILVALYSIGTTILIIPTVMAIEAKQDAWIAALLGVGISMLLVGLYCAVGNLIPSMSLVELMEELFGKWLGKACSLTFIFFSLVTASELLYIVGTFITTQIMPETPMQSINAIFACIVIMGVRLGVETLARSAELLFPLFVFLFLVFVIFVSPQIEFDHIQPVLEADFKDLFRAAVYFTSVFSLSPVVLLMVFPASVNRPKKAKRTFFSGTIIAGVMLIMLIALSILVLGVETTQMQTYPSYALAKKVSVGNFFQRIEIVMAGMWFISIYFKLSLYFYASVTGLAQTLHVKDYRFLTLPMGFVIVALSMVIHPNILHSVEYNKEPWLLYVSTYGLVLPLLLLVVYAFRRRGKRIAEERSAD